MGSGLWVKRYISNLPTKSRYGRFTSPLYGEIEADGLTASIGYEFTNIYGTSSLLLKREISSTCSSLTMDV